MGEGATLGSRKLGPGDDAVMAQRIVEDHVAGFQQGADRGDVGGVAAHHHDAGFGLVMVGQRLFEADMAWALAGDDPARGGRGAELVDGPARRLADVGMSVEPEIIVGREIDEALAGDARPWRPPWSRGPGRTDCRGRIRSAAERCSRNSRVARQGLEFLYRCVRGLRLGAGRCLPVGIAAEPVGDEARERRAARRRGGLDYSCVLNLPIDRCRRTRPAFRPAARIMAEFL